MMVALACWLAILAIPALVWRFAPGPVRLNLRATVLWLPWYLLACTLLPALLGGLAGELATVLAGVYLLPFGCLAIGMSLGKRHGLCPLFPVVCALCLLIVVGKRTPALCLVPSISALLGNAAGAYPRERGGTGSRAGCLFRTHLGWSCAGHPLKSGGGKPPPYGPAEPSPAAPGEERGCVLMRRTDQWLLGCFAVTMAVYTAAFAAAFSDLPLNIPPWHQLLLLYFHAFPMFFLQLLLCRRARAVWRLLVPLALLAVPGVIFLSAAGWMVMGWFLLLWWCAAPLLGSALAWLVWAVSLRKSGRGLGKPAGRCYNRFI